MEEKGRDETGEGGEGGRGKDGRKEEKEIRGGGGEGREEERSEGMGGGEIKGEVERGCLCNGSRGPSLSRAIVPWGAWIGEGKMEGRSWAASPRYSYLESDRLMKGRCS